MIVEDKQTVREAMLQARDTFFTFSVNKEVDSEFSERADDRALWYAPDERKYEAMVGLMEARKKVTTSRGEDGSRRAIQSRRKVRQQGQSPSESQRE